MMNGISSHSGYGNYSAQTTRTQQTAPQTPPDIEKIQQELFKQLDANSDGGVSKDELSSALASAQKSDSNLSKDTDKLLNLLDKDANGSLSREETAALVQQPPPPPPQDDRQAQRTEDKRNVELASARGPQGAGGPPPPPPPPRSDNDSDEDDTSTSSVSSTSDTDSSSDSTSSTTSTESTSSSTNSGRLAALLAAFVKQYESNSSTFTRSTTGSQLNLSA